MISFGAGEASQNLDRVMWYLFACLQCRGRHSWWQIINSPPLIPVSLVTYSNGRCDCSPYKL